MAHINYPTDLLGQTDLLVNIKAKVAEDGDDSPLLAMLSENKIDLDDDIETCNKVLANNTLFLSSEKESQNYCEKRNTLMKPIMKHLKGGFQYLKGLYATNFKALGDWGGTISDSGKITYPAGTEERVKLFFKMKEKNDSYTETDSPLLPYLTLNKIDLTTDATNASKALVNNTNFEAANKEADNAREHRDTDWVPPLANVHKIGSFLQKLYPDNSQALGIYGFVVIEKKRDIKERTMEVETAGTLLNKRAAVGETMTNDGLADLYLYKGKTIIGEPIPFLAGETMPVPRYYSTLSVQNKSTTDKGKITFKPKIKAVKS